MQISEIPTDGYERVVHARDDDTGLNAFISIHDTTLGPALGGVRMRSYGSETEALADANRLARAMTYKAAVAQTGQGGGKAVILGDPATKSEKLFIAMGRFIESLGGQYLAAEDMNITVADLEIVRRETKWVTGLAVEHGGSGNPSPLTALGCLEGIKTCLAEVFGNPALTYRRIVVQGVGAVGGELARLCVDEGADVAVADVDPMKVAEIQSACRVEVLANDMGLYETPCDVFSPCAAGGVLNDSSIPRLTCPIVAGAANNQLLEERHGDMLHERGILYAPDYVINAGGIINISCEFLPDGYSLAEARRRVLKVGDNLREVFEIARREEISPAAAADRLAEQRLAEGRAKR